MRHPKPTRPTGPHIILRFSRFCVVLESIRPDMCVLGESKGMPPKNREALPWDYEEAHPQLQIANVKHKPA